MVGEWLDSKGRMARCLLGSAEGRMWTAWLWVRDRAGWALERMGLELDGSLVDRSEYKLASRTGESSS